MKKFFILLITVFTLQSCSKKNDELSSGNNSTSVPQESGLPSSFTQRVLLETFTGAWCSTCPDADYKRDQITSTYSGKVISISIHNNDSMAIPAYMWYYSTFGCSVPSGMVSRIPSLGNVVLNPNQWLSNATSALGRIAKCGLAISSSISGGNATIEVKAGFIEDIPYNLTLNIYLVEDNITRTGSGFSQANGFNNISGSPFYNQGNPINNYVHNRVVRKIITPNGGLAIPSASTVKNGIFTQTFTVSLAEMEPANSYIVAFISKPGSSPVTHEILNVHQAKVGQTVSWN